MLKFYWNGIKENGGKLQRAHYSMGALYHHPAGTITIYAREYSHFSKEIWESFAVKNETELLTDYFDKDTIRVEPTHPLYAQVLEACQAHKAHNKKLYAKRAEKFAAAA